MSGADDRRSGASFANAPDLPSITLPKGGGAITGIGEKLTIGQATGTASLSVPVFTSPGRSGFGPSLALVYDSGAGNGPYGLGWRLQVPSVTRKTSMGLPRYQDAHGTVPDSDVFILSDAEDLVPFLSKTGDSWIADARPDPTGRFTVRRYRPRVEAEFARIERWEDDTSRDVHWRTISRDNVTNVFGLGTASRITDPDNTSRVFTWLLDHSYDSRGNVIAYEYKRENSAQVPKVVSESARRVGANRYLKRIRYGNSTPYVPARNPELPATWHFEVVFDYGEHDLADPQLAESSEWPCRPDPFSAYRSGFEIRTHRLCRRVLMFHYFPADLGPDPVLVRSTDLSHATGTAGDPALPVYSLLNSITQTGYISQAGGGYQAKQLPPLELTYSPVQVDDVVQVADPQSLANVPAEADGQRWRWTDLDGEGLQGILTEDDGAWYYKRNVSAWAPPDADSQVRFEPLELVATRPILTSAAPTQLADLHGDGRLCAVSFTPPLAGYLERGDDGKWLPFRAFPAAAAIDWSDPDMRTVDLDGDGLADVLCTEEGAFTWYPWLAGDGFGPGERVATGYDEDVGPALVLAAGDGSTYLADMTGDRLTDLVRVRNGEVCYWPNLGYGRFGTKVTMVNPPWFEQEDLFDQRRVRLADLDGSGTADLVYLGPDRVMIWFNQSGNSWTDGTMLSSAPGTSEAMTVTPLDLLGGGSTCLVWSSPLHGDAGRQLRYIDLMGGTKPHLLTGIVNNMGAETSINYAPSTRFYLQDRYAGRPWATRLPFPVHVVANVRVADRVSRTRLISAYSYHHGYFDGTEREFRGFGMVEQSDAESVPAASGTGAFTAAIAASQGDLMLPPVRTSTWFHTGAYIGGEDIAAILAAEYFQGDPAAVHLGGTVFAGEATAEQAREACRALRGRVLRTEVYADDGTPQASIPYACTENRYQVVLLQPPSDPGYGSVYASQLESLSYHYERDPGDPRVTHDLTLDIDEYGTVRKSASVGYPRRSPAFPEQGTALVTYTEHDVVNVADQPDWYRLGVPVETRSFELTGFGAPAQPHFDSADLLTQAQAATSIPYEADPAPGSTQKRLISRERIRYRKDDLSAALPSGQVEPLALVDRTYKLAMTPGLATAVYGAKASQPVVTAIATGEGGYVDLDGDSCCWAPSARSFYSPDPANPDPGYARQHFYLPQGHVDPFGATASVGWENDLVVTRSTDPVGNTTSAQVNYRTLLPWLVTDPNLNRVGARYDEIGMTVAIALMGKDTGGGSDEGDHLDLTNAEAAAGDDPTTTFDYDLYAYQAWTAVPGADPDHPAPVWAHTRARVRHKDPATGWLETYVYTDGLGRVALTKAQAEPGDAPVRDASGQLVRAGDGSLTFGPTDTRWVGTGRVVYDNKAHPVKAYEPFFDSGPGYDDETDLVEWGVTAITRYDPLGRAIRVDKPDGTYTSVEFSPWRTLAYDESDNVLASSWYAARRNGQLGPDEQDAATKALVHANTPGASDLDTLGRVFRTVADNGGAGAYETLAELDISGRVLTTTDALGRAIMRSIYDLPGAPLSITSTDAGQRWLLRAADGQPLRVWDSRGHAIRHTYDAARRPVGGYVTAGAGPERLAEQVVYGEGQPAASNLRTHQFQVFGGAGVATTDARDFKGNVTQASQRLLADVQADADWSAVPPPALNRERETLRTSTTYDALNRITGVTTPDNSVTIPTFNERSLLAQMAVRLRGAAAAVSYVTAVSYDPKGQRKSITYGNGTLTSYTYDPETFRLTRLVSSRPPGTGGGPLQDLSYTYDPVGNITRTSDTAQSTVFFANQLVAPKADYTYDALYRLIAATGREHLGQAPDAPTGPDDTPFQSPVLPSDPTAMRNYTEYYTYDRVGNITRVRHATAGGTWIRAYRYDEPNPAPTSNRLTSTQVGSLTERYTYDAHGNMTSMLSLPTMAWDFKDQLQATARQASNGPYPATWYRYDNSGTRVRKTTLSSSGSTQYERIYFGNFEIYREYGPTGAVSLERQTLVVPEAANHLALVETTIKDSSQPARVPTTTARYQFSNHLGSACLELDENAAVITYEEYFPYGATSFIAGKSAAEVGLKRYRYSSKECDSENSLVYYGVRYYAAWLGRWTACDPGGIRDSPSLYVFVTDNPVAYTDRLGLQSEPRCYVVNPVLGVPVEVLGQERNAPGVFCDSSAGQPSAPPRPPQADRTAAPPVAAEPSLGERVHNSQVAQGAAGLAYGVTQSYVPGGFLAPSPAPRSRTFEFFRGVGQTATGIAQVFSGLSAIAGGGGTAAAGAAATPLTGGASLLASLAGAGVVVVGVAEVAQGLVNVGAGVTTLGHAVAMSSNGGPSGRSSGQPSGGSPPAAPRPSLLEQAERAGVRDEIEEGPIEVFAHGTTTRAAQELVETQGHSLSPAGGNFGGQFHTVPDIQVAQAFANRTAGRVAGGQPAIVGVALPRSVAAQLRAQRLLTPGPITGPPPGVSPSAQQWVFQPGAIDVLKSRGFFFNVH